LNLDRPMLALSLALYAYCFAHVLSSLVNNSFTNDATQLISLATFLFFPLSYSTWSIVEKRSLVRVIKSASAAACWGALILAIFQFYWLGERAKGGSGNAIVFASVACLSAMVCLASAISTTHRLRVLYIGAAIAGTLAVIYSGTRIVWSALPIVAVTVFLINRRHVRIKHPIRFALFLAVISVVIAIVGFQVIPSRTEQLFSNWVALDQQGDYNTNLGLRVALWELGYRAFLESPLFGHGMQATKSIITDGMRDQFSLDIAFSHFHNGFLTTLVEAGIPGMLALAAVFFVASRNAASVLYHSSDPNERFGATMIVIAMITYLISGTTGIIFGHDILDSLMMVFLVTGTYLASGKRVDLPATLAASQRPARTG
jgi:O-antigen ligase